MEKKDLIVSLLFTSICCLVMASTFLPYQIVDNNFRMFPIACAVSVLLVAACVWIWINKTVFYVHLSDVLLICAVGYYLLRYDFHERLADWKIHYAMLLWLCWLAFRFMLSGRLISSKVVVLGLVGMGCVQACWGLLQLYGILPSYHPQFAITGSFYNPGPYTGYIAMLFPLALYQWLTVRQKGEMYVWAIMAILLFGMIPAGMSRSAWMAVSVSSLFVLAVRFNFFSRLEACFISHRTKFVVSIATLVLLCTALIALLFAMRPESAYGRLFIWKNTWNAIVKSPFWGYGPGSFPQVYGREQSDYFSKGTYRAWEEYVADAPEYAFNEYLQWMVEGGIVLLILVLAFATVTLYKGLRNKRYGVCAGLISFYVFAFSAYPLQVPPFGVVTILFSALAVNSGKEVSRRMLPSRVVPLVCAIAAIIAVWDTSRLRKTIVAQQEIILANKLKTTGNYAQTFYIYEKHYDYVRQNPRLLLHYARMLGKENMLPKAIEVLEDAEKVSCDVAILNTKASYYMKMKKYEETEITLQEAIHRTPIRIYPYYMLARLYATPAYYDRLKMRRMARLVLEKEPKVNSEAVRRMKEEARTLLFK